MHETTNCRSYVRICASDKKGGWDFHCNFRAIHFFWWKTWRHGTRVIIISAPLVTLVPTADIAYITHTILIIDSFGSRPKEKKTLRKIIRAASDERKCNRRKKERGKRNGLPVASFDETHRFQGWLIVLTGFSREKTWVWVFRDSTRGGGGGGKYRLRVTISQPGSMEHKFTSWSDWRWGKPLTAYR